MLNLTIILGPSNKNSLLELALVLASAARILKLELALEGRRNINHEYGLIFGIVLYGLWLVLYNSVRLLIFESVIIGI